MSRTWQDDDDEMIPLNADMVWGIIVILLGLSILIFTPPDQMSPWWFGASCTGFITGLALIAKGYRKEERR